MRCGTNPIASVRVFIARFDSVYAVDPALAQVPAPVRQAAIALLNRLTNGVDRLLALEPTPQGWRARFLENGKPVLAEWDGRELVTTLLSDLPLKGAKRTDATRKNCVKGRWCVGRTGRGSCVAANRKCHQQVEEQAMAAADRLSEALRAAATEPDLLRQPVDPWADKGNPPDARGGQVFNRDDREWVNEERQFLSYLLADQAGISSARYVVMVDYTDGSRLDKDRAAERYLQERLAKGDFLDGDIVVFPKGWANDFPPYTVEIESAFRYNARTNQLEPLEIPPERVSLAQQAMGEARRAFAGAADVDHMLALRRSEEEGTGDPFNSPGFSSGTIDRAINAEERRMARYAKLDNQLRGRRPQGLVKPEEEYVRRAREWARENGLGEAANGFDAEATKAHDVAHPILHEMLGMNSRQIQQFFGTNDLLAEEAAVNALEWMSRGAMPSAALANGLRLARSMSRGTPQAGQYRTPRFRSKLAQVVQKLYDNPDFHDYLKVVRKHNRVSQTVTAGAGV